MKLNGSIFLLMINFQNIIISGAKYLERELDSEPICSNKFRRAKIRSGKISTDSHSKDPLAIGFNYIFIWIILIYSILEKDGKYYLQCF